MIGGEKLFYQSSDEDYIEAREGILRKTLVWGEEALLSEYILEGGSILPVHKHPEEQLGYLVAGHIILYIDGEKCEAYPGDSWAIPANVEHSADIIEDSIAIEIFSPVRREYLPE
jgi:quercetin dioxygenase-like cupin family protein